MADNNNYNFPRGIGDKITNEAQPYMILTSYESKNAIESVGVSKDTPSGIPLSSIALYIPPNSLRQTTSADWGGVEGGALRAAAGGALSKITGLGERMGGSAADMSMGDELGTVLGNIFGSAATGTVAKAAGLFDKQSGMLSAGAGIAVNNHMAMAYKGPGEFRTHEFAFNFFPKNHYDAVEIKNIIDDFENGMLPRMMGAEMKAGRALSAPFFQSPRHWDIEFYNGGGSKNTFLFKIAKSVITNMIVNHDPNSTISLHSDGSPVQTAFSLTFQEIELPISSDKSTKRTEKQLEQIAQNQETRKKQQALDAKKGSDSFKKSKGITVE